MKKMFISILSLLLLICCKQVGQDKIEEYQIKSMREIKLGDETIEFVKNFMKSLINTDCIYELYIDKKTENEYFLTLFSLPNDSNYLSYRFPVNYTIIGGRYIFIYSGIEDFIDTKEYDLDIIVKNGTYSDDFEITTESKVILKDTSYVVKNIGIPFTSVRFTPSIIIDEDIE